MSWFSDVKNRILDASIAYSFDKTGFYRHETTFNPQDLDVDCTGKRFLITGANSGLGFATAIAIANRNGIVHLLCRNLPKAQEAQQKILSDTNNPEVYIDIVDMSDLASIQNYARSIHYQQIDALIHNAGILPSTRQKSPQGFESTFATNVLGPQLLTTLLLPILTNTPQARLIWVSSGGMYPVRLNTKLLQNPKDPFDGVQAYAQTKRTQVILSSLWAEKTQLWSQCMHPGWADTTGVQTSLPRFQQWMKNRLRNAEQGADTIVWLAIAALLEKETSGGFWFDRSKVQEHFFPYTTSTQEQKEELWALLENYCALYLQQ